MGGILQVDTIQNNNATTLITQTNVTTITFGVSGQNIVIPSGVTFNTASATVTLPSTINATTINVTTVVLAAGAVGTPSLTTSGDTNTGIFFPTADTIAFTEGGTEVMRIDSDGDVGIGTSSPSNILDVSRDTVGGTNIRVTNTNANTSYRASYQLKTGASANVWQMLARNGGFFIGVDGTADYVFINTSGTLSLGNASNPGNYRLNVEQVSAGGNFGGSFYVGGTGAGNQIRFGNDFGTVGSITTSGGSTAFNTSSDYRLKENVNYNFDATTRLKQLKPARFNFKTNLNKTVDGFLAHEVSDIVPEAITGTKDATVTKEKVVVNVYDNVIAENIEQADWEAGKIVDENGNTRYPTDSTWVASKVVSIYQGIDQAKLTPLLTKALQEAIAKIEQLEARLTALENN